MPGVHDWALIKAAIGRPYVGYYRRIDRKAAALIESLSRNHGFVDGNKRTAFLIVDLFIYRSGYRLRAIRGNSHQELENLILRIVREHTPFEDIVGWFKQRIRRRTWWADLVSTRRRSA